MSLSFKNLTILFLVTFSGATYSLGTDSQGTAEKSESAEESSNKPNCPTSEQIDTDKNFVGKFEEPSTEPFQKKIPFLSRIKNTLEGSSNFCWEVFKIYACAKGMVIIFESALGCCGFKLFKRRPIDQRPDSLRADIDRLLAKVNQLERDAGQNRNVSEGARDEARRAINRIIALEVTGRGMDVSIDQIREQIRHIPLGEIDIESLRRIIREERVGTINAIIERVFAQTPFEVRQIINIENVRRQMQNFESPVIEEAVKSIIETLHREELAERARQEIRRRKIDAFKKVQEREDFSTLIVKAERMEREISIIPNEASDQEMEAAALRILQTIRQEEQIRIGFKNEAIEKFFARHPMQKIWANIPRLGEERIIPRILHYMLKENLPHEGSDQVVDSAVERAINLASREYRDLINRNYREDGMWEQILISEYTATAQAFAQQAKEFYKQAVEKQKREKTSEEARKEQSEEQKVRECPICYDDMQTEDRHIFNAQCFPGCAICFKCITALIIKNECVTCCQNCRRTA